MRGCCCCCKSRVHGCCCPVVENTVSYCFDVPCTCESNKVWSRKIRTAVKLLPEAPNTGPVWNEGLCFKCSEISAVNIRICDFVGAAIKYLTGLATLACLLALLPPEEQLGQISSLPSSLQECFLSALFSKRKVGVSATEPFCSFGSIGDVPADGGTPNLSSRTRDPKSMQTNGPQPLQIALKAMILQTFGVEDDPFRWSGFVWRDSCVCHLRSRQRSRPSSLGPGWAMKHEAVTVTILDSRAVVRADIGLYSLWTSAWIVELYSRRT